MSDRTLSELANAEIVPDMGGPNGYLVRFSEGEYDTVNKSGKNTLLLKNDVSIDDTVEFGGITVDYDLDADEITLSSGMDSVDVPDAKHENVLWAVYDEDGPRLNKLFDKLYTPTVRQGLMDQFMPRFRRGDEISKQDDGWLVGDDILVEWDGSNHPVSDVQTHIVQGSKTVLATEEKEAREISMPAGFSEDDTFDATAPDGRTFEIDAVELRFLTTVGLILDRNPSNYDDDLYHTIGNASVVAFTDTRSGLHHGHGLQKHTLGQLGVTEEAQDRLWYNEYDHTGVHEMKVRRDEFEAAPIDVFEDAPNDDTSKWRKIENTSEKAPIPKEIRADLEERYE